MNWDQIQGQWLQFSGHLKSKWGKLTDDDLKVVAGKKDQLIGKIQERYGVLKDDAERQVNDWITRVMAPSDKRIQQKDTTTPTENRP